MDLPMGYSIFLRGESFEHDGWVQDLGSCGLDISPMGTQFAEILAEHRPEEIWLHPRGGVRGVTVKRSGEGAELSLPTGVSEADFLLTGVLIRAAMARGAVAEDEEGRILTGTDEEMRTLGMEYRQFFWSAIYHQLAEGESILPVGGLLHLKIDPSERGDGRWDALERLQLDKMGRYQESFIASLMQVKMNGVGKVISNYHHLPTLLSTEAEYYTMMGEHGDITGGLPLPVGRFCELLGDRVESLGSWRFVPAIDFTREPELAAKLKAAAGEAGVRSLPVPPGVLKSPPTQSNDLTGEDWMLLAKMAVLCLYLVAGADGSVDRKEIAAIRNLLANTQSFPHPVLAKIMGIARTSLEHIAQQLQEEGLPPMIHFALLLGVLRKFPEDEAAHIKAGFLASANAVAEASGGFFGFGSKVSKREKEVLDFLKGILS
ncbi:MAG: hypothetical protein ABI162_04425 [Luteolibacter sp.]